MGETTTDPGNQAPTQALNSGIEKHGFDIGREPPKREWGGKKVHITQMITDSSVPEPLLKYFEYRQPTEEQVQPWVEAIHSSFLTVVPTHLSESLPIPGIEAAMPAAAQKDICQVLISGHDNATTEVVFS